MERKTSLMLRYNGSILTAIVEFCNHDATPATSSDKEPDFDNRQDGQTCRSYDDTSCKRTQLNLQMTERARQPTRDEGVRANFCAGHRKVLQDFSGFLSLWLEAVRNGSVHHNAPCLAAVIWKTMLNGIEAYTNKGQILTFLGSLKRVYAQKHYK
jgi:hypothetical protein